MNGAAKATTPPRRLNFPIDKKYNPTGYMNIGEAIDRVGYDRRGDEWGSPPAFSELPFFKGREGQFVRYTIKKVGARYSRKANPLRSQYTTKQLVAARRMFLPIYQELRDAMVRGEITTFVLDVSSGKLEKIHAQHLIGIRSRTIFSTGYLIHEHGSARFRVLIADADLDKYLSTSDSTSPIDKPSAASPRDLVSPITGALESVGYKLQRKALLTVIRSEYGQISGRRFEREVWHQLPPSVCHKGRPPRSLREGGEDWKTAIAAVTKALKELP